MWRRYAGVAEDIPPPALLELRINLRKRGLDRQGEGERSEAADPKSAKKQQREEQKITDKAAEGRPAEAEEKVGEHKEEREPTSNRRPASMRKRKHGDRSSRTRRQTNADANMRK